MGVRVSTWGEGLCLASDGVWVGTDGVGGHSLAQASSEVLFFLSLLRK